MNKNKPADTLTRANERLKAGKIGVTISAVDGRLYLRANLPPKPGAKELKDSQQRIALHLPDSPDTIKQAEAEALRLGALVACREFSWNFYIKEEAEDCFFLVKDWVSQFEEDYFQRRSRNHKSQTTWEGDYLEVLKRLPQDEYLTAEIMKERIVTTQPDTKTRKRTCMVMAALARFAGIHFDPKPLSGTYSPGRVNPRCLPDDETIVKWFAKIKHDKWRWVYAMQATYGLRNHEVFHLDMEQIQQGSTVVSVLDGKTGARRIWPFYPEWFDLFELKNVCLPSVNLNQSNSALGSLGCHYFAKLGLPFPMYSLRHCWAVRTIDFDLQIALAAQQMGHSVQTHTQTYHHWISDRHHEKAFQLLMLRPERPRSPV